MQSNAEELLFFKYVDKLPTKVPAAFTLSGKTKFSSRWQIETF
jgi:hypothetical protein